VHEHAPAVHDDFAAVASRLRQLTGPRPVALNRFLEHVHRDRVLRAEKIVAETTDHLFPGEAVELLCAAIPVDDRPRQFAHEYGFVNLFEQVRLSAQGILCPLALDVLRLQRCIDSLELSGSFLEVITRLPEGFRCDLLRRTQRRNKKARQ